jgi:hypothetical protein
MISTHLEVEGRKSDGGSEIGYKDEEGEERAYYRNQVGPTE